MVTSPPGRPPGTSTSRGTIFNNNHTNTNTNTNNSFGSNNNASGNTTTTTANNNNNNNNNNTAYKDIFQRIDDDLASFRKRYLTPTENTTATPYINTDNNTSGTTSDNTNKDILQQFDAKLASFSKLLCKLHLTATLRTTSPRPASPTSKTPSTVSSTVS